MQSSAIDVVQRLKVLHLYKNLYKNIRTPSNKIKNTNLHELLRNEFRQHSVSDSKYCMEKNEMQFMANAYLTYLNSTRNTLELYARYCKGERSIEDSARLVGLKLPKLYQENSNGNGTNKN